jgi:hypothetical protein
MKLLLVFLFSTYSFLSFSSSCCVSNTSVSNLMILPADWQETFTVSQTRVIGDANQKGQSTFRRDNNKEITNLARLDLAYGWTPGYQTGISVKYQNRSREFNNTESNDSGWNDLGLSHAFRPSVFDRLWFFQTLNVPTATSVYNSRSNLSVDAHGTGTYLSSAGLFVIYNVKEWDFIFSSEIHHSFRRTFKSSASTTEVGSFWGSSLTAGAGYIPWRSKARYGFALTPRIEGAKSVSVNNQSTISKESLVWDTSFNFTYTLNAENALGFNYTDQTIWGPVKNTLLNRSISFQFQTRWL